MLIILVLVAFAAGPGLESPSWPSALTFALQVVHCLPQTRKLRGWWTLAAQAVLFPWAALPGFLAGSVLLSVRGRSRWALFAGVALAAGLTNTATVYDCANAVGNAVSQGLVILALTRLHEVRAELHATRGELAERSVVTERAHASRELECSVGGALAEIIQAAGRHDLDGVTALARQAARRVRREPDRSRRAVPTELTPRMMLPIMVVVHLSYLVVATLFVLRSAQPAPRLAGYLVLLTAVVGLQFHHSLPRPATAGPRLVAATLPAQVVLAWLPMVLPGTPYPQLVGLATGAVLMLLPGRLSWPISAVLLAAVPGVLAVRGVAPYDVLTLGVDTAVLAAIFYGIAMTTRLVHQVRETRRELAEIAVARERQRIARDTHDLLGQGLAVIVLKAELAARGSGPAGTEFTTIADIARRSLADLRAISDNSTTMSLERELRSARDVLAEAGTELRASIRHGSAPSHVDGVLATVLREAVTNVLRHSRASVCRIDTDRFGDGVRIRVANDSVIPAADRPPGRGIGNLSARVAALGGSLTTHTDGNSFELVACQPACPEVAADIDRQTTASPALDRRA